MSGSRPCCPSPDSQYLATRRLVDGDSPVAVVLGGFGVYATLRAFENAYYFWGPYLSPFYSPLIDPQHRWWPFSPALLILAGPLGFRATCYYYRKAYYRAFSSIPRLRRR